MKPSTFFWPVAILLSASLGCSDSSPPFPSACVGDACSIENVTGTVGHGLPLHLHGAGFGSHAGLNSIWFLGGESGWIESAEVGTDPIQAPSTSRIYPSQGQGDVVTDEDAWSGTKSLNLKTDPTTLGSWASTWAYQSPEGFSKIFASFWYRFEVLRHPGLDQNGTPPQHKFTTITTNSYQGCDESTDPLRSNNMLLYDGHNWTPDLVLGGANPPNLGAENTFLSCEANGDIVYENVEAVGYPTPSSNYWKGVYNHGASDWSTVQQYNVDHNLWQRVDVYLDAGTWDAADGYVQRKVVKPFGDYQGHQISLELRYVPFLHSGSGSGCYRCDAQLPDAFVWYILFDITGDDANPQVANNFVDDPYVQLGTQARIELGNAASYSECSRLEMQKPTIWQDDEIVIELNYGGSFQSGDGAYLFIIGEDGTASDGFPILLE